MARPEYVALLNHQVTVTNPYSGTSWEGRLVALHDDPGMVIEQPDGSHICLPQYFGMTPVSAAPPERPPAPRSAANGPSDVPAPADDAADRLSAVAEAVVPALRRLLPGVPPMTLRRVASTVLAAAWSHLQPAAEGVARQVSTDLYAEDVLNGGDLSALWLQAGGGTPDYSHERYRELIREQGHRPTVGGATGTGYEQEGPEPPCP